jgi:type IV pilus assembly protein PilY1
MITKKSTSNHWHSLSAVTLAILFVLTSPIALSDDIEVYYHVPFDPVPPNILFVLDESGSMNNDKNGEWAQGLPSRNEVLKNALKKVFSDKDMAKVNAALLGYTSNQNDYVKYPPEVYARSGAFKVISESKNQKEFIEQIDNLRTINGTPTVYALDNAVKWFKPGVTFKDEDGKSFESPLEEDGVSVEDMRCAPNLIVILSDGEPNCNRYNHYNDTECSTENIFGEDKSSTIPGDRCAYEIATYANNIDLMTDDGWGGIQNITIDTIGFHTSGNTRLFMERLAQAGGGSYYDADDITLAQDLIEIITNAQRSIKYNYNSPAIPFNAKNAAISGDVIYVPLFQPETSKFWRGNLKKYSIKVSTEGELVLKALRDEDVLNEKQEFQSTRDLFCKNDTCRLDRGDPLVGGAAHGMTGSRKLYSNLSSESDLSNVKNHVMESNKGITANTLGAANAEERKELLNWISRSPDYVATEKNPSHIGVMGAPIHTQPVVVTYSSDKEVVLIPTSEGVLEAIDAKSGDELWAFMPKDLLPGIRTIKNNDASTIPYYGLDGPMTYYEVGSKKMVIFGMRRGGRKYHILDITNRLAPVYVAEISNATTGISKLGQTWSKPLFVKIKIDGTEQEALVFGGGYDPDQDNANSTVGYSDDEANAIYIVKASDGSLLKSISNTGADVNISEMTNAIASDLATVDLNGNGIVERLYASDVGGRIIRIDINEKDSKITGGVIADINAGAGTGASAHRKFFTSPQIGYYNKAGTQFLTILIGTGDITNPLDSEVTDRFYMIKDPVIWTIVPDWSKYDVANHNNLLDASDTTKSALTSGKKGWYIDYSGSEKSFSKAILYDYSIFFTTYSAETVYNPADLCETVTTTGTAKLYGIDLLTANAVFNWDGTSEDITYDDRFKVLALQGIPPSPKLVFPAGGKNANGDALLGKTVYLYADLKKQAEWSDRFRPIYWEEVINE